MTRDEQSKKEDAVTGKENPGTKEKILDVAVQLFAKKGYDGTSVREIAQAAEVNLAAVNYHFQNKQTLYWEVTLYSHLWLESEIAKLSETANSVTELALATFRFLENNQEYMKNAYAVFLSESTPEVEDSMRNDIVNDKVGPPGEAYFLEKIRLEVGNEASDEAQAWAVKNIFSYIFHWALVLSTGFCRKVYHDHPDFQFSTHYDYLSHTVQATLKHAKTMKP